MSKRDLIQPEDILRAAAIVIEALEIKYATWKQKLEQDQSDKSACALTATTNTHQNAIDYIRGMLLGGFI
jgi:hypothetical protein